ncbi:hypothetical protein BGZ98_003478 [Dissophora globulifera]|nr:hypothetical protein BGZ98_003478 [Dissophora globulifera]
MLHEWYPIRDLGALIVSCLGIVFLTHQLMYKSRRLDRAVGRSEMRLLFLTFIWIQVLQMFTIGGIFSSSRTAMIWTSALELGAIACFFWILLVNVFIRMESFFFILLTSAAIMGGTTFLALDLAMDITRHHDGHSAELYVLTLIFPASAAILFTLLAFYLGLALAAFGGSQAVLFMLSPSITHSSNGHVNASTLAFLLNILSIMLLYLFWRDITDDTWGDGIF